MNVRKVVALVAVIVLTAVVGVCFIGGVTWGIYEIRPLYEQIPYSLELTDGIAAVYESKDIQQDPNLEQLMDIVHTRLEAGAFPDVTIAKQGTGRIRIEVPNNSQQAASDILQYLTRPGLVEFVDPNDEVMFTGADMIAVAAVQGDGDGEYVVAFQLSSEATLVFAEATSKFLDQTITVRLDGETISQPKIDSVITNGNAGIPGYFTEEGAIQLANQIRYGVLPVALEEVESRPMTAPLGENALEKSWFACALGMMLMIAGMAVLYRVPGLIADLSMVIYSILLLFCLTTIPGVQLSLAGFAGIMLSIAMTTGAHVLLFVRIREEISSGKSVAASVEAGFQKIFMPVLDGGVMVLIVGGVLLLLGASGIKSFAVALLIGTALGIFVTMLISRGLMKLLLGFPITRAAFQCPFKQGQHALHERGDRS